MSLLRQILISAVLLALVAAGAATVSEDARAILARAGIDASPLALAAVRPPDAAPQRPSGPTRVVLAEVVEDRAATRLRTIGTGRAIRSVTLHPQVPGIVARIGFVPGTKVAEGTVLAALADEAEQIALARAEVALAAATSEVARMTALATRNATAQVTLDDARQKLAEAELDVREARFRLEQRLIRAPFDGIVGLSSVEPGDLVSITSAIGVIDDRSSLEIDLVAPERFAALIGLGQPVTATTPAVPGADFVGTVTAIDNQVDPESRTLRMRAAIPNKDDLLRPGFSFTVTLDFPGERHAAVPALAVQWQATGAFVWKVVGGKVQIAPVEVVERSGDRVLVRGGVVPGDTVVSEGVLRLRPGLEVAALDAPRP